MPRTITIFLSAPPGDGLRAAREHFHEYVKPVLVAGALDWEVIEGRREGEVRAGLASKIRRVRRRSGENVEMQETEETTEDRLEEFRRGAQIKNWDGVQGDLILGRHTWKEYVRGLHEGWLGPLDPPQSSEPPPNDQTSFSEPFSDTVTSSTPPSPLNASANTSTTSSASPILDPDQSQQEPSIAEQEGSPQSESPTQDPQKSPDKSAPKKSVTPPYILPTVYSISSLSPEVPATLAPSTVLPFPHLLGFLNTPTRVYRFLNRRHLADETGRSVATLVLASDSRVFHLDRNFVSSADPEDANSPSVASTDVAEASPVWEQEKMLLEEEVEWHKSAWAPNTEDSPSRERPWQEKMIIDERIGSRMRVFDLPKHEEDERIKDVEAALTAEDRARKGRIDSVLRWLGLRREEGVRGWEMGLKGAEDE